ncbi:MAG: ComEC/Rec2 family competence protein [Bacteroidales bacterium]
MWAYPYRSPLYLSFFCYVTGMVLGLPGMFFFLGSFFVFFHHQYALFRGIGLLCSMIALGSFCVVLQKDIGRQTHYTTLPQKGIYQLKLVDTPTEKTKTWKIKVEVQAVGVKSENKIRWYSSYGFILIYLPKDSVSATLQYGSVIYAQVQLKPIENFKEDNGKTFDYKTFLSHKQIYAQAYIKRTEWQLAKNKSSKTFMESIFCVSVSIHTYLQNFFHQIIRDKREADIACALVLGSKEDMDEALQQSYRSAGVVHILCVSGMHLGIFAYVVSSLLSFLSSKTWQRWLKFLVVCIAIWGYAFFTGFSVSVLRSSCMFTLVSLGQCVHRKVSTSRSLVLSAMLLFSINPYWLYDIGCQLSYLAVVGLTFFVPCLKKMYRPSNKIVQFVWNVLIVSISAQLATTPLLLFYFQQFSLYFWLGNLVVSPLATVAIPWGIGVCVLSYIHSTVAGFLCYGLSFVLKSMNMWAAMVEKLPNALLSIPLSFLGCVGVYVLIIALYIAIKKRHKNWLKVSLISLCFICWIG